MSSVRTEIYTDNPGKFGKPGFPTFKNGVSRHVEWFDTCFKTFFLLFPFFEIYILTFSSIEIFFLNS